MRRAELHRVHTRRSSRARTPPDPRRMPNSIRPTDVGKRVTLQFFDESGARSEVVGMLERAEMLEGEPVLHIRRKDDSVVMVPVGRIRAGRVVTPRAR